MTEKQRNLIIYLDCLCKEKGIELRAANEDMLGVGWFKNYKNYTQDYTNEVITRFKVALAMPLKKERRRKK